MHVARILRVCHARQSPCLRAYQQGDLEPLIALLDGHRFRHKKGYPSFVVVSPFQCQTLRLSAGGDVMRSMRRWIFLLLFGGCAVTSTARIEKDWSEIQDNPYEDLKTVIEFNVDSGPDGCG
jgi:hypothetical protein